MTNLISYIVSADNNLEQVIIAWRNPILDRLFFGLTLLGHWVTIAILCLILCLFLKKYNKVSLILPILVMLIGTGILTLWLKLVVGRARPIGNIPLYIEKLSSFPSAHAALAMAFFGFLIYAVCRFKLSLVLKIVINLFFSLIIIAVGFSRLYLGVHFLSDVLAGYLVGLLWVLVAMHLSRGSFSN